jgi:hypothetical protein
MAPFCTTAMASAFLTVESLCATTTVVRPTMALSSAACTICSELASNALVASSSKRILGFFRIALAIAMRCF